MAMDPANRRKFERSTIGLRVLIEGTRQRFHARVEDWSASGLRLASQRPLELGEEFDVTLPLPEPLRAQARVVRCEAEGASYSVAAEFRGMSL